MAKNKRQKQAGQPKQEKESLTLADQLGGDVLAKLKEAKQSLAAEEQKKEEERTARLAFERKQREKNMSFEELFEKYGDQGSKY
ncbi:YqkE family protein [Lysinibacillus sp. LZ02]|uniref:YqkE family protein n=1 Tax=Lysinibacillus sp. LZ02 TaxID=3420668 RepID=UPI003D366508